MASDVLNEFWKLLPEEDKDLQRAIEKLIYHIYWSRIGDVWPIIHRKELNFTNEAQTKTFKESSGWVACIRNMSLIDRKLNKYLHEPIKRNDVDIEDAFDKKQYEISFAKQKDHSLSNYIGDHGDDDKWCYAAIYNDDISDAEIIKRLLSVENPLSNLKEVERYTMEQLLLKSRNESDSSELYECILDNFNEFVEFFKRIESDTKSANQMMIDSLLALGESATSEIEEQYLKKIAKEMRARMKDGVWVDKIERALAVADASMRQAKFQNKNITLDFIKDLY
jgi:hypothetical protein